MTTKWTSNAIHGNESSPVPQGEIERFVVLLLYGKNSFGDKIYSFLKIKLPDLPTLKSAILSGGGFNPSDFGTVVAAGRGEPTSEVRAEVSSMFEILDTQAIAKQKVEIPEEKKSWDEY